MTAYIIFTREQPPHDAAEMAEYGRKTRLNPPDPNLKPIVLYGATEALEGDAPDGTIILQFPTMDDARNWYRSPGYQDAMQHRQRGADYRAFIVEGL